MVDFQTVEIKRKKDKSSPTNWNVLDRLRTAYLSFRYKIKAGNHVTFKRGVTVTICEGGSLRIGEHSFFHPHCQILLTKPHPLVEIGKWVFVGMHTIIASKNKITIGDYTIFAPRCYIIDHEHGISADNVILNQNSVLKETKIGRDCYFGTGAVVLGGVTIGDGAVVGAGSIVTGDIPPYQVWAGNPARFIKARE